MTKLLLLLLLPILVVSLYLPIWEVEDVEIAVGGIEVDPENLVGWSAGVRNDGVLVFPGNSWCLEFMISTERVVYYSYVGDLGSTLIINPAPNS